MRLHDIRKKLKAKTHATYSHCLFAKRSNYYHWLCATRYPRGALSFEERELTEQPSLTKISRNSRLEIDYQIRLSLNQDERQKLSPEIFYFETFDRLSSGFTQFIIFNM